MFKPIINNFQPFFVKVDLAKNAFEVSATTSVVVNPFEQVIGLDDYAARVQRLGKSHVGFAQLSGDVVYLSVSHALCDGGFLKYFIDVVLPKLVEDKSFREEMGLPADILRAVHPGRMQSVEESSVLSLRRDQALETKGVNSMEYCAFDLAFRPQTTARLLLALSLAVEKAN